MENLGLFSQIMPLLVSVNVRICIPPHPHRRQHHNNQFPPCKPNEGGGLKHSHCPAPSPIPTHVPHNIHKANKHPPHSPCTAPVQTVPTAQPMTKPMGQATTDGSTPVCPPMGQATTGGKTDVGVPTTAGQTGVGEAATGGKTDVGVPTTAEQTGVGEAATDGQTEGGATTGVGQMGVGEATDTDES